MTRYDRLKAEVRRLLADGRTNFRLTNARGRADWEYGTTKIENDDVTMEMAEEAVKELEEKVTYKLAL